MSLTRRSKTGRTFLVLAVLAMALLTADVLVADSTAIRDVRFDWTVEEAHTVLVNLQLASPGDVVVLRYEQHVSDPIAHYDFYVTEHEDAHRIARGEEPRPEHIYYQAEGLPAETCCMRSPLQIARPVAPAGEPDDRLALVWVYHYLEGVTAPTEPEARDAFQAEVIQARFDSDTAETIPHSAVRIHQILLPVALVAALGALVSGILWFRGGRPPAISPRPGHETEALVGLIQTGYDHLCTLRGLLVVAVVFFLLSGAILLTAFFTYLGDFVPPPIPNYHTIINVTFLTIWAILVIGSAVALYRVHKTATRWARHLERDPLEP